MSIFRKKRINKSLTNTVFGRNVVHTTVCDSTNELAKRKRYMPHGTLFITDMQTAGKGRNGRVWESEKKSGIYMSLLLKPNISPDKISQITLVAGLAVCRAVGCNTMIKWPNDVVIGKRKVCGILTERVEDAVICGIGINANTKSFPQELSDKATSLYIETGEKQDRDYICALIMNEFEQLYDVFEKEGFVSLRDEYTKLCVNIGRQVSLTDSRGTINAVACGVSDDGELIVKTNEGIEIVNAGEVSVRGIYGYI